MTARTEVSVRIGTLVLAMAAAKGVEPTELAALAVFRGQITNVPIRPRAVGFRHGRPASIAEHQRLFGVAPTFAEASNWMILDRSALDLVCPAADPGLSRVIERHAEALLAARPEPAPRLVDRLRAVLASALGQGDVSLVRIAANLKMSQRTLQRKLEAESHTFDALLDDVRHDLALRYLADSRLAVTEIAYLLGYSEPSPFHRAFKRWTGKTPSEARKSAA